MTAHEPPAYCTVHRLTVDDGCPVRHCDGHDLPTSTDCGASPHDYCAL